MRHRISVLTLRATAVAIRASVVDVLVGVLVAGGLAVGGCAGKPASPTRVNGPGDDFRRIAIVSADGASASFSELLGRRPTLVSFWAPWCEPCVNELPDLERLARTMAPCGGAVVGVAVGEAPAGIAAFTRARQLTYPQFVDEHFHLADALGQTRVPTTVVFDSSGRVVFVGKELDARAVTALAATLDSHRPEGGCAPRGVVPGPR